MNKNDHDEKIANSDAIVEEFFADPNTTPNSVKGRRRIKTRNGIRKEKLHIQKLKNSGVNVERISKSQNKTYEKLNASPYTDDGKTKSEIKRACNKKLRSEVGDIPDGSAFKKGAEGIFDDDIA